MLQLSSTVEVMIHQSDLVSDTWSIDMTDQNFVLFKSNQSYIKLKKFPYPQFFLKKEISTTKLGYDFGDGEAFSIELSLGSCSVSTPGFGQLQLFYLCHAGWLLAADSFAGLAKTARAVIPLELDEIGVLDWLLLQPNLTERTILKGIRKLAENSQLLWNRQSHSVSSARSLEAMVVPYASLNSSKQFAEFDQHLLAPVATVARLSGVKSWSSCLSGGVDSAVVTTLVSEVLPTQTLAVSNEPATIRVQQQRVLKRLLEKLQLPLVYLQAGELPLLEDLSELLLADPYLDPYANWSIALAQHVNATGNKLVFTGIGGDDFFAHHSQGSASLQSAAPVSSRFLRAISPSKVDNSSSPTSLLPSSLSDALLFYHLPWMLCGIWPVSPLVSSGVISFSLYLKDAQKRQKQFLRSSVETKLGIDCPEWRHKLLLSPVFYATVSSIARDFSSQQLHPRLLKLGLLEKSEIDVAVQQLQNQLTITKQDMRQLFQLYKLNRFLQMIDY